MQTAEPLDLTVRIGTPADIDAVMALAGAVANENAPAKPSVPKILRMVWPALHKDRGLVGIVGPKDGSVHGFVLLRIITPDYSDETIIEECGVYVHPDWRGQKGGRAALLYKFIKRVSDEMGYKVVVGVLSNHRQESKLRYYERFFGPRAGAFFVYNPRAATEAAVAAE